MVQKSIEDLEIFAQKRKSAEFAKSASEAPTIAQSATQQQIRDLRGIIRPKY